VWFIISHLLLLSIGKTTANNTRKKERNEQELEKKSKQ
jgi:hypothetical protein